MNEEIGEPVPLPNATILCLKKAIHQGMLDDEEEEENRQIIFVFGTKKS